MSDGFLKGGGHPDLVAAHNASMTPDIEKDREALVAGIVADRATGTPGPWEVFVKPAGGHRVINPAGDDELGTWMVADVWWLADARRIARLPDMEAAYLTLTASNAALQERVDLTAERERGLVEALKSIAGMYGNRMPAAQYRARATLKEYGYE